MKNNRVAILGASLRFPGANDPETFWSNLKRGVVSIRRYEAETLLARGVSQEIFTNPNYVPFSGTLDDIDKFDPVFFGFSQREASILDPQQRLLLECSWELLESIGYGNPLKRPTVGVFAGASMNTYLSNAIKRPCDPVSLAGTEIMLANDKDYLAPRVSYKLDLKGPSITVQTGCSSSLVAVHLAVQSLLAGECDIALAGGVSINTANDPGYIYEPGAMFSRDGSCRAFDVDTSGTVFGDGCGMVALRRYDDALVSYDPIRAVIIGSATNNDGADKVSFSAPGASGQQSLIEEAMYVADVQPEDVGLIETHGTGTILGDPIEFRALSSVFKNSLKVGGSCALGAVKANIGHLAAASGIAGFIKAVLSVEYGEIPPHPTFHKPLPELHIEESPFYINSSCVDWPHSRTRIAGVSSFGVGGSNAHIVIANHEALRNSQSTNDIVHVLPLSAPSQAALEELSIKMADRIEELSSSDMERAVNTLQFGRRSLNYRRVAFGRTKEEVVASLRNKDWSKKTAKIETDQQVALLVESSEGLSWIESRELQKEIRSCIDGLSQDPFFDQMTLGNVLDIAKKDLITKEISPLADLIVTISAAKLVLKASQDTPTIIFSCDLGDIAAACALEMLDIKTAAKFVLGVDGGFQKEALFQSEHLSKAIFYSLSRGVIRQSDLHRIFEVSDKSEMLPNLRKNSLVLPLGSPKKLIAAFSKTREAIFLDPAMPSCDTADGPIVLLLGFLWAQGMDVDWSVLGGAPNKGRVSLPVHSLSRRRCWVDSPPSGSGEETPSEDTEFLYTESWLRLDTRCGELEKDREKKTFVVFDDEQAFSTTLIRKLKTKGHHVFSVRKGSDFRYLDEGVTVHPEKPETIEALCRDLNTKGIAPDCILFFWKEHLQQSGQNSDQEALGVFVLLEFLSSLRSAQTKRTTARIVTQRAFDVLGNETVDAFSTMMTGLVRVIPQEMPMVQCQCIDVSSEPSLGEDCAENLYLEIISSIDDPIIALRNSRRWAQKFIPAQLESPFQLTKGSTCLITGGLGSVGATLGTYLAQTYGVKLALVSRFPFPDRSKWGSIATSEQTPPVLRTRVERLLQMEQNGISASVITADVTDYGQMLSIIKETDAQLGKIQSFIHAAGLSGKETVQLIQRTTRKDWSGVLDPKVAGANVLHSTLIDRPIELGCFISSLATVAGGMGLAAYTAANCYLDGFAHEHKRPDKNYCAIDWDGWSSWDDGGAYQSIRTLAKRRAWTFTEDVASRAFGKTLNFIKAPRVIVSRASLGDRLQNTPEPATRLSDSGGCSLSDTTNSAVHKPIDSDVVGWLTGIWSDVLQCDVDPQVNFFDLGGDSLIAAVLIKQVNNTFGCSLSIVDLFDVSTVLQMAEKLLSDKDRAAKT